MSFNKIMQKLRQSIVLNYHEEEQQEEKEKEDDENEKKRKEKENVNKTELNRLKELYKKCDDEKNT